MRCLNRVRLQKVVIAATAVLLGSTTFAAEKAATPKACAPVAIAVAKVVVPAHIGPKTISTNVSPDKLAQNILFESFTADYGPEQVAKEFTPVNTAFLEVPVTLGNIGADCELLGYTLDVRGFVDVTSGGRAIVTVLLAGESKQIEFPFERQFNGDFQQRFFFLPKQMGTPGATVVRSPLRIQLLLQVETAQPQDSAVVTVDTVDLEVRRAR